MLLFLCCTAYGKPEESLLVIENLSSSKVVMSKNESITKDGAPNLKIINDTLYKESLTIGKQKLSLFIIVDTNYNMLCPFINSENSGAIKWIVSYDGRCTYRLQIADSLEVIRKKNKLTQKLEKSRGIYLELFEIQSSEDEQPHLSGNPKERNLPKLFKKLSSEDEQSDLSGEPKERNLPPKLGKELSSSEDKIVTIGNTPPSQH